MASIAAVESARAQSERDIVLIKHSANQGVGGAQAEHERQGAAGHRLTGAMTVALLGRRGAAAGLAWGGAAESLGGGAGQVMLPSLMTVRPRMASSSILTSMVPSPFGLRLA